MRTTINLDEALVARAQALSGVQERSALLREALEALIQRESARRLARLGGTEPQLENVPRRREDKRLKTIADELGLDFDEDHVDGKH